MKKTLFFMQIAIIVASCDTKDPEVTIGTNTLVEGEETFVEVKYNKMRSLSVYSLHPEDSICTIKDIQKKSATVCANKVGNDTIQVAFIYTSSIFDYEWIKNIPITVLPKE